MIRPHISLFHFLKRTRGYSPTLLENEGYYHLITPAALKPLIREILRKRSDPEKAREAESFLHSLVLTAIAMGARDAKELAIMATMTHDIEFSRFGEDA